MHHEPYDYLCPFCDRLAGNENQTATKADIVLRDEYITAFVSPKWWVNNPGNVIIIPNQHIENIYDIDDNTLARIAIATKQLAWAIRSTYPNCTGISTRQHNEPDGNQNVWHFHTHVFPRYPQDKLYENHSRSRIVSPAERVPYAAKLRTYFATNSTLAAIQ